MTPPFLKEGVVPKWLEHEKELFKETRDKNKDGQLDIKEVMEWIYPNEQGIYNEEAKHLIREADGNSVSISQLHTYIHKVW